MRMRKLLVAVLALTMLATGMIGNTITTKAISIGEAGNIYISEDKVDLIIVPGVTKHMRIPVRTSETYMENPTLSLVAEEGSPFTMSQPKLCGKEPGSPADMITYSNTTYVEFDVIPKDTADIGLYTVTLNATAKKYSYESNSIENYTKSLKFDLQILEEKAPAQLTVSNITYPEAVIGHDSELSFSVNNEGEIKAYNTYVSIDYAQTGIAAKYTSKKVKLGDIEAGNDQRITLPISILSTATAGNKTLIINLSYKDDEGTAFTEATEIYVKVVESKDAPSLVVEKIGYDGTLKPGNDFTVVATIHNSGLTKAQEVKVKVKDESLGTSTGIIKNYYSDDLYVGGIKADGTLKANIPLSVTKDATGGIKELVLEFTYLDEAGMTYTTTAKVYPEIIGETSDNKTVNLIVSGVKQSPAQPAAGEKLEVAFYVENKSEVDIKELKVSTENLTGNTFIPLESEPYQYIGTLEGGKKILVKLPLMVADSIPEGLNNLSVKLAHSTGEVLITIPIRDVQNDVGSSSIPKLIVSKYVTDVEELRAGTTFNFTFDLYNTNSSVAAKNITVTVTQPDSIFTVTQGSNSFFINKIEPGETVSNTLEMKVKSDASTKAYPLKIVVEYEYDGAKPNPTTGEVGENKTYDLNLQAVENSRPVVDYVNVYSWDGNVMAGNPATLAFEFYNMGRSPLNNVIATVEGDFTKSDGNMYFIGNVAEGGSTYAEFEVIPNLEGTAKGTLRITFEDSNGDEVEFLKEFEAVVQAAGVFDPGMGEGGSEDVFNPVIPEAKKPILPVWAFVIVQLIIFGIFVPVSRKVIISAYKAKLRKKDMEQY